MWNMKQERWELLWVMWGEGLDPIHPACIFPVVLRNKVSTPPNITGLVNSHFEDELSPRKGK